MKSAVRKFFETRFVLKIYDNSIVFYVAFLFNQFYQLLFCGRSALFKNSFDYVFNSPRLVPPAGESIKAPPHKHKALVFYKFVVDSLNMRPFFGQSLNEEATSLKCRGEPCFFKTR